MGLNLGDFDRDSAVLTIGETKFFKSRLVPVGSDLRRVLEVYIDHQWPPAYRTEETPLLGTVKYERILRQTAELVYSDCAKKQASIAPRPPDFNHGYTISVIPLPWSGLSPGIAKARTYSACCRI